MLSNTAVRSNIVELDRPRLHTAFATNRRLVDGLASRLEALEERNQDLVKNNARLVEALERANSILSRFEQSLSMSRDLTSSAIDVASEIVDRSQAVIGVQRLVGLPATQSELVVPAEHSANQVEVLASPFTTFTGITAFHRALKRTPGVASIQVRSFDRGELRLAVECNDTLSAADILATARPELRETGSLDSDDIAVVVVR